MFLDRMTEIIVNNGKVVDNVANKKFFMYPFITFLNLK